LYPVPKKSPAGAHTVRPPSNASAITVERSVWLPLPPFNAIASRPCLRVIIIIR